MLNMLKKLSESASNKRSEEDAHKLFFFLSLGGTLKDGESDSCQNGPENIRPVFQKLELPVEQFCECSQFQFDLKFLLNDSLFIKMQFRRCNLSFKSNDAY